MISQAEAAALIPRRLAPDPASGRPGGWLIEGPRQTLGRECDTVWQRLRATLLEAPDTQALLCGEVALSRAEVRRAAETWAAMLPGKRIGVHMARAPASVLLTLAIWCREGVTVPIAIEHPPARLAAIARSCDLDAVLADRALDLPGYAVVETAADFPAVLQVRLAPPRRKADVPGLCLIVHTSGSTGAPKGVLISHANLLNRIACLEQLLDPRPDDRILYKTSAVFDVHLWEFVLPIAAGCLLVIFPQQVLFDLRDVAACLVDTRVTIAGFVPALLRLLLEMPSVVSGTALRTVFCGGEAWTPGLARTFHERLPGRCLFNSYGPAETTLAVANWRVPNDPNLAAICIGAPMPNIVFLVEDAEDAEEAEEQACNPGASHIGSLCIGGAQTALGIVGDDGNERRSERFFERHVDGVLQRFYATGDRVRLHSATGMLQFRGRQDNQVKLNGIRIELEEIEAAVLSVETVEGCIAFVTRRGDDGMLCAAYRTCGNVPLAPAAIRRACAKLLPASFVPARMIQVERLPLTPSGKHDRTTLIAGLEAETGALSRC